MKRLADIFQVVFLGAVLYTFSVITKIISVVIAAAIAAVFVMPASAFAAQHTEGAFPDLGYLGSLGLSFILIFTSYIGSRGVAHYDN